MTRASQLFELVLGVVLGIAVGVALDWGITWAVEVQLHLEGEADPAYALNQDGIGD